jgi:microcin C transport system substrate-binding protein
VLVDRSAPSWARRDIDKCFHSGELTRREVPHHNGAGMQAFHQPVRS